MGFFDKLKKGLEKTRENLGNGFNEIFSNFKKVDEELLEELEEKMILADVGMETSSKIINELRNTIRKNKIESSEEVKEELIKIIKNEITPESKESNENKEDENLIKVILIIGVNGVGKTTSIGKIASNYKKQGKNVLIVPADTFRAAAVSQLEIWANRAGVDFSEAEEKEDPSSVVYRSLEKNTKNKKYDIILIDTAGRLHNKKNLMNELEKINKTINKVMPNVHKETFLVLDGTTGQNAIIQAEAFSEVTDITGYIITKLDGTSKGGVIIGIVSKNKLPIKYIGVGEQIDDMQEFNSEDFVRAILN